MHFREFPVFWAYVFRSGKSIDPTLLPPLLVKNFTIVLFLNLPLANGGWSFLLGDFGYDDKLRAGFLKKWINISDLKT